MLKQIKIEYIYLGLLITIFGCFFGYEITRIYGFIIYPDEFGYWAVAGKILGYDWSEVTSLGSYYSFGYGILLLPYLAVTDNPILSYKMAVGSNFIMVCIALLLLWQIVTWLFKEISSNLAILLSGVAIFYPPILFYLNITLTEISLLFFFLIICFLFLKFIYNPKIVVAITLFGALSWLFFIHMRTIGILVSMIIILSVIYYKEKIYRKPILIGAVFGMIIMLFGILLKLYFTDQLYDNADMQLLSMNDFAGQLNKFSRLTSWKGISNLLISFLGKIFYLGISSFGVFYWGMFYLIKKLFLSGKGLKNKGDIKNFYFHLFLFLAVFMQIGISAFYTMDSLAADGLVYGRYNDFILPVVLVIGLYQMLRDKQLVIITLLIVIVQIPIVLFINYWMEKIGAVNVRGFFISGISYMLNEMKFDPSLFFIKAFVLGCFLILGTMFVIIFVQRRKQFDWLLAILVLFQIILGININEHYMVPFNRANFYDLNVIEIIKGSQAGENSEIFYIYEDTYSNIGFLQFQLPRKQINVLRRTEMTETSFSDNAIVILEDESKYFEKFQAQFRQFYSSGRLNIFYN